MFIHSLVSSSVLLPGISGSRQQFGVHVRQLVAPCVPVHGMWSRLVDVYGILDPPWFPVWILCSESYFVPSYGVISLRYMVCDGWLMDFNVRLFSTRIYIFLATAATYFICVFFPYTISSACLSCNPYKGSGIPPLLFPVVSVCP